MARDRRTPLSWYGDEAPSVVLRRATKKDQDQILAWRNDPWIVSLSAGQRFIDNQDHARWFSTILRNPSALLFIIVSEAIDVGTVRIERVDSERAAMSIYLLRHATRQGLGPQAIAQGCRLALGAWPSVRSLHAVIRADNAQSIAAFRKVGFRECPLERRLEQDASAFVEMLLPEVGATP
jgi:RimJ/RimL family protein N-acetyltransferase